MFVLAEDKLRLIPRWKYGPGMIATWLEALLTEWLIVLKYK